MVDSGGEIASTFPESRGISRPGSGRVLQVHFKSIYTKRQSTRTNVARVIAFMASNEAACMTGHTIFIDGGGPPLPALDLGRPGAALHP